MLPPRRVAGAGSMPGSAVALVHHGTRGGCAGKHSIPQLNPSFGVPLSIDVRSISDSPESSYNQPGNHMESVAAIGDQEENYGTHKNRSRNVRSHCDGAGSPDGCRTGRIGGHTRAAPVAALEMDGSKSEFYLECPTETVLEGESLSRRPALTWICAPGAPGYKTSLTTGSTEGLRTTTPPRREFGPWITSPTRGRRIV